MSKSIYLTKEDFLKGVTLEAEDFSGPIGTVSLRGLSTLEVNQIVNGAKTQGNEAASMTQVLITGLQYPKLTVEDAEVLLNGSFAKMQPYLKRIQALSGMTTGQEQAENFDSLSGGGS